jgi:hypothetical protein
MSHDEALAALLVVSFAVLVTAHVTLLAGLAARRPRWQALLALALPPAAPFLGWRARMNVRTVAWVLGAVGYAVTRWLAGR